MVDVQRDLEIGRERSAFEPPRKMVRAKLDVILNESQRKLAENLQDALNSDNGKLLHILLEEAADVKKSGRPSDELRRLLARAESRVMSASL